MDIVLRTAFMYVFILVVLRVTTRRILRSATPLDLVVIFLLGFAMPSTRDFAFVAVTGRRTLQSDATITFRMRYRPTSLPRAADLFPARNEYRSHSLRWSEMRVSLRAEHDRWRFRSIDRAQSSSWRLASRSRRRARPATSIIVTRISMNACRRYKPSSKPLACLSVCIGRFGPLTQRRPAVGVPMIAQVNCARHGTK